MHGHYLLRVYQGKQTSKASLALALCKNVSPKEEIPLNSVSIIDGMMLVQRVKGDHKTFNDIAKTIFEMAMKEGISAQRVDIVFDKYNAFSVKSFERDLRGEHHGTSLQSITGQRLVRHWRSFLSQSTNNSNFITFLVKE